MRFKLILAALAAIAMTSASAVERGYEPAEAQGTVALTGDVIVKFEPGSTLAAVGEALDDAGVEPILVSPTGAVLTTLDGEHSVADAVASLGANPSVDYAEPDVAVSIDVTPNDTYYADQSWHFQQIKAPQAWDLETGEASTVVAVVDTGVQSVHPDLNDNIITGANFVTVPIQGSSNSAGQVRITTNTPHSYLNGDQVTISGHSVGGVNGTWTVSVPASLTITSSSVSAGTIAS
jgi:hypothetical protein